MPTEDRLLQAVVTILAPVFLPLTTDAASATTAAADAIRRIRGTSQGDLLTLAQAIAFGVANIPLLVQSLKAGQDPDVLFWLNRNAADLSRARDRHRQILRQQPAAQHHSW